MWFWIIEQKTKHHCAMIFAQDAAAAIDEFFKKHGAVFVDGFPQAQVKAVAID